MAQLVSETERLTESREKTAKNSSIRKKNQYIININRMKTSRTPQLFTTRRGFIILIKFFQFLLLLDLLILIYPNPNINTNS